MLAMLALTMACSHGTMRTYKGVPLAPNVSCSAPDCTGFTVRPYVRIRTKYGIGCLGDVAPGTTPNPIPPPLTYAAYDAGKEGVPPLTVRQASILKRIQHFRQSKTLRFGWVEAFRSGTGRDFIVFDATDGPCEVAAGGYEILNGGCDNMFYQPGENPYRTHAGSTGDWPCKRPWGYSRGD